MKYLYLIIRHMFPRRRWKRVDEVTVNTDYGARWRVFIYEDQFGNVKKVKSS